MNAPLERGLEEVAICQATRLVDAQDSIIGHGETAISQIISCIEAARRGGFNLSRAHAMLARLAMIELLYASRVAADIELRDRVRNEGADRG